jgi:16S rRNA processing protein RimM
MTEASFPDDAVEVGRIHGAWGVKGWIKVQPFAADPQALFSSKRWFLKPAPAGQPVPPLLRIAHAREQGGLVVAQVQDIMDRDAAQALRGAGVFVSRASFPTPTAGEYYWVDLIGLRVVNRQSQALGEVVGLIDTGAHSVLRVKPAPAESVGSTEPVAERLIPFVAAYIDQVDIEGGCIVADWGLDY